MHRIGPWWQLVLLVGSLGSATGREAHAGLPEPADTHALLDVPYVPQTPELCGGAAVAMVLRYWGARDVFPQDFAPLVTAADRGILTDTLIAAVRDRRWQTFVVPAADETARERIQSEIDRGRPLIALIEVGPRTYHYVVIVGSTGQEVVFHDPARAPYRVLPWTEFDRVSKATGRWLLLVLPPVGFRSQDDAPRESPMPAAPAVGADSPACTALVSRGVDLALAGDRTGAEDALVAATVLCPNYPPSWRELAGLRFSQARWPDARDLALAAVRLAPNDGHAWHLVATARYLLGDSMGALAAWNRTGEPRLDTLTIHGAERTRHPVLVRAMGLQPRQTLTPQAFGRALRRLHDVPAASNARMRYEPIHDGLAKVDVVIAEREVLPKGWLALGALGAQALVLDEVRLDVAGLLGAGELTSAAWRWSPERPRVALRFALPSPQGFPGTIAFEGSWERQAYDATPAFGDASITREGRRRIGVRLADWSTRWLKWQTGAALDRVQGYDDLDRRLLDGPNYLALDGTLDVRLAADRVALAASGGWWTSLASGSRFGSASLLAAWRSSDDAARPTWSALADFGVATREAPLALWPGAGTGQGRSGLLRAHPLLADGVVTGPAFGRRIVQGSLEYVRPVRQTIAGSVAVAVFVDAARAWHRMTGLETSPLLVDAGAGVRVRAPGVTGAIRLDIAHGLRGGGTTLSAGWGAGWPR